MRQSAAESKDWTSCPAKRRLDIKLVGIYAPDGSTSSRSQDDGSSELIGDRRLVVVVLTETWNRSPPPGDTAVDCDRLRSTASTAACRAQTTKQVNQLRVALTIFAQGRQCCHEAWPRLYWWRQTYSPSCHQIPTRQTRYRRSFVESGSFHFLD